MATQTIPAETRDWRLVWQYMYLKHRSEWPAVPFSSRTEAEWNAWNGWNGRGQFATKPTYAQLVLYYREAVLDRYANRSIPQLLGYRDRTLPESITERSTEIDLATGTALLARRVSNDEAGSAHDLIVIDQDGDGTPIYLRTPQSLERELNLARNEQLRLKSAQAIVHDSLRADRAKLLDESLTLVEREAAQTRLEAATTEEVYEGSIRTALASLSIAPIGLADSKEWHINRLERDGAARKRYVTGADSRQGDWLDHSCAEQRTALDSINGHVQKGRIAIHRVNNTAQVVREYNAASLRIGAVAVSGSAEWSEPPSTTVLGASVEKTLDNIDSNRNLQPLGTFKCSNPTDSTGAVAIEGVVTGESRVTHSITYNDDDAFCTLQLTGTTMPDAFQVHLHGRNSCGPKQLTLRFTPPSTS